MPNQERKNLAILFADVSGSSSLYKALGDTSAKSIIDSLLAEIVAICEAKSGHCFKTIGDEVMLGFGSVNDAAEFAIDLQRHVAQSDHSLKLRIGAAYGDVILDKGDAFGRVVNDAAYLTSLAVAEQVIVDHHFYQQLPPHHKAKARIFDHLALKGSDNPSKVYRLYWHPSQDAFAETQMITASHIQSKFSAHTVLLLHQDQQLEIFADDLPFLVGRDSRLNDLTIRQSQISRQHCRLDMVNGKLVLIDNSTNGSYIQPDGGAVLFIRRESYPLIGKGVISLGTPIEQAADSLLSYQTATHYEEH